MPCARPFDKPAHFSYAWYLPVRQGQNNAADPVYAKFDHGFRFLRILDFVYLGDNFSHIQETLTPFFLPATQHVQMNMKNELPTSSFDIEKEFVP